ncbi:13436_t:CDS:2 [Entrophospora sp. SA101]|nr:13436_t:CDS:2 [Entrophospora sp. SA101]
MASIIPIDERRLHIKELQNAKNFEELMNFWGHEIEEHAIKTHDNYILGAQRISNDKKLSNDNSFQRINGDDDLTSNESSIEDIFKQFNVPLSNVTYNEQDDDILPATTTKSSPISSDNSTKGHVKPVVLLWHGLMTCSEIWVCNTEYENRLACLLADAGYDVWFGNSRGNKYSMKHVKYPNDNNFWNYSMDELIYYDLPDTINYILKVTGAKSLTYIGFSQGSALCFATLSLLPDINKKINLFIALAPATNPKALKLLFGWDCENISELQKSIGYFHLFSCASVKSLVHWLQIIHHGKFRKFEDPFTVTSLSSIDQDFPLNQISTPLALFYGGRDNLINIEFLMNKLNNNQQGKDSVIVSVNKIENYEHLDFLWAKDVNQIFPEIFNLLKKYNSPV